MERAKRRALPLATLDGELLAAARALGVKLAVNLAGPHEER
jgi:hypothetical protein